MHQVSRNTSCTQRNELHRWPRIKRRQKTSLHRRFGFCLVQVRLQPIPVSNTAAGGSPCHSLTHPLQHPAPALCKLADTTLHYFLFPRGTRLPLRYLHEKELGLRGAEAIYSAIAFFNSRTLCGSSWSDRPCILSICYPACPSSRARSN